MTDKIAKNCKHFSNKIHVKMSDKCLRHLGYALFHVIVEVGKNLSNKIKFDITSRYYVLKENDEVINFYS